MLLWELINGMANNLLVFLCLIEIVTVETKDSCSGKECPKGSRINSECLCVCKEDYYRLEDSNDSLICYKDYCPPEAEKVPNSTFPLNCKCNVSADYWGNNYRNCHLKEGGCRNKDLVRQTGECGCSSGLQYDAGECKPELKPTTSPELTPTTSPELMPTSPELTPNSPGGNNTGSLGNKPSNDFKIKLGVGLGVGLGVPLVIAAVILFCWLWRRKAENDRIKAVELGEIDPLNNTEEGGVNHVDPNSEQNGNSEGSNPEPQVSNPDTPSNEQNGNSEGSNPEPQDSNPSNGQDISARPNGLTVNNYYGTVMYNCSDIQNGENNRKTESKATNKMRHDV